MWHGSVAMLYFWACLSMFNPHLLPALLHTTMFPALSWLFGIGGLLN